MDVKTDYNYNYQKENIKRWVVKINKKTESKLFEHLNNQSNVQGYIKDLIKKDIEKKQ